MKFTETSKGIWTSDKQGITAAVITRDENGQDTGLVHDQMPMFEIREGEYKGRVAYRVYKAHLGGYSFEKRLNTLDKAIKFANEQ